MMQGARIFIHVSERKRWASCDIFGRTPDLFIHWLVLMGLVFLHGYSFINLPTVVQPFKASKCWHIKTSGGNLEITSWIFGYIVLLVKFSKYYLRNDWSTLNVAFTSTLGSVIVYTRVKVSKYFNQYSVAQKSCFSKTVYVNFKNKTKDQSTTIDCIA